MKTIVIVAALSIAPTAGQAEYADVNGLRMYYEIHGTGQPLVLLHGGGSTIETSFGAFRPQLAKARQVIAVEEQAHGRTADIDRPLSFAQTADDVAALLGQLGIEQADVVGYSNGGTTALQLALRHPRRVRRIVAMSAIVKKDGMPADFWGFMKNASLRDMPAELQDAYKRVAPRPQDLQTMHDKCVARMLAFADFEHEDLRGLNVPVLIMVGDADVVRPEHAVEMFRLLPRARLAILPGVDHMAMVKRTDTSLRMIEAFLDAP
jgi:pimeloyl-ACP methyl ester carboxylesterase